MNNKSKHVTKYIYVNMFYTEYGNRTPDRYLQYS